MIRVGAETAGVGSNLDALHGSAAPRTRGHGWRVWILGRRRPVALLRGNRSQAAQIGNVLVREDSPLGNKPFTPTLRGRPGNAQESQLRARPGAALRGNLGDQGVGERMRTHSRSL